MNYNDNSQVAFNPLEVIQRRKWQLAGCLLLVCALSVATVTVFAPKYEATAQVKVTTDSKDTSSPLSVIMGSNSTFNSQLELLKSDRVYELALARLNSDPTIMAPFKMKQLRSCSRINADLQASIIKITGVNEKAGIASAIANSLASSFVETSSIMKSAQTNVVLDQMTDQVLILEKEVSNREQELEDFRKENMIIGNNTVYENTSRVISNLEEKLQQAENQKVDIQGQLALLQKITVSDLQDPLSIPIRSIREDNGIINQLKEINTLTNKEREYSQIYLPGHRELQKIRQRITMARDNMARHAQTLLISLQKQNIENLAKVEREKAALKEVIQTNKADALNNSEVYTKLQKLNKALADTHKMRDQVHNEIQQFKIKQSVSRQPIEIVDAASVPESTAGIEPRKRAGSVLLLGVALSFLFVSLQEKMRQTEAMSNAYQMPMAYPQFQQYGMNYMPPAPPTYANYGDYNKQPEKGVEILGSISNVVNSEPDVQISDNLLYNLVHTYPHSRQAEQYREISTSLLSRFSKTKQSVVITGNEAKCGKTILTCNLAHLLAQAGRTVAIVSTNPQSDKLAHAFTTGRTMYADLILSDSYDLNDYICGTDFNHISTLKIDLDNRPDTDELAQAITVLNCKLQSKFDWILYDTTSIGYSDTDNILQVIGKAIIVSRASSNESKIMTTEQIEQRGAVSLGCVEMPTNSQCTSYQHV